VCEKAILETNRNKIRYFSGLTWCMVSDSYLGPFPDVSGMICGMICCIGDVVLTYGWRDLPQVLSLFYGISELRIEKQ
jgi:hypothetical protein